MHNYKKSQAKYINIQVLLKSILTVKSNLFAKQNVATNKNHSLLS